MLPYLPLSVYGFYLNSKSKKYPYLNLLFIISFLIPLFGLFLGNRFIPFFDLFAIILAGYAATKVKFIRLFVPFLIVFILLYILRNSQPLINQDEFNEIKLLSTTPANSYILVTDNEYTPWIYGYSSRNSITPGFGEFDTFWSSADWQQFWLSNSRSTEISLLKKLPQPLYVYFGDKTTNIKFKPEGDCFQRFSWHVWQFVCR